MPSIWLKRNTNTSMVSKKLKSLCIVQLAVLFASCGNMQNVSYIKNYASYTPDSTLALYEMRIQPKDLVNVYFFQPDDPSVVSPMILQTPTAMTEGTNSLISSNQIQSYIVDNEGNIDMPLVGKVNIAGKTKKEAEEVIREKAYKYIRRDKELYVNVSLCEFPISVAGEVENPNVFNIPSQKVNIFEALAMAGDIKITGRRDNVMILRLETDGTRSVHKLDMTDVNVINSPYYYLQQRDIVYVEPTDLQKQEKHFGNMTNVMISGVSVAVSIGSLLYQILNK